MGDFVTVTTTVADAAKAAALARGAVESRLAACAQVCGPISSVYWWQGDLETATEYSVTCKTTAARADALVDHLGAAHPFDVPEILVTPIVGGNRAYLDWVAEESRPR